jgi:uncharacterized protein (DUF305 family)
MTRRSQLARAALVALALVLLTACGGTAHNDADVAFTQEMIPHHHQAVMMARLATSRDAGPEVADLAERIERAQVPEIKLMSGWLRDWDESSMGSGGMGAMGYGDGTGMMDPGQMHDLARARGAAFDRLFLTQMIEHHRGAVTMAEKEQSEGQDPEVIALAKSIEKSQTAEIAEMRKLLAG